MGNANTLKSIGLVFLISLLLLVAVFLRNRLLSYLPLNMAVHRLAKEGVSHNEDWQPVLRQQYGLPMVLVPAGCFQMGSTDEQLAEAFDSCYRYYGAFGCRYTFENEQPAYQVCLSEPFWFGLTAVTNRQYGSGFQQHIGPPTQTANWPHHSITWQEASDFCTARGARLPTEAEWEFAARGPDAWLYPWGNQYDIHLATLRKISPAPVGEIPNGASWVGALDMSGGIGEWVADGYGPYSPEPLIDPLGVINEEQRIVRGGDWFAHAAFFVRTAFRDPVRPDFTSSKVGFRCAGDFVQ